MNFIEYIFLTFFCVFSVFSRESIYIQYQGSIDKAFREVEYRHSLEFNKIIKNILEEASMEGLDAPIRMELDEKYNSSFFDLNHYSITLRQIFDSSKPDVLVFLKREYIDKIPFMPLALQELILENSLYDDSKNVSYGSKENLLPLAILLLRGEYLLKSKTSINDIKAFLLNNSFNFVINGEIPCGIFSAYDRVIIKNDESHKVKNFQDKPVNALLAIVNTSHDNFTIFTPCKYGHVKETLLVLPQIEKNYPQILQKEILEEGLTLVRKALDPTCRIVLNTLVNQAGASVNHFHWQLFEQKLPIENIQTKTLYCNANITIEKIENYPLDGYVFSSFQIQSLIDCVWPFIEEIQKRKIGHNLLIHWDEKKGVSLILVVRNTTLILDQEKVTIGFLETFGGFEINDFRYAPIKEMHDEKTKEKWLWNYLSNVKLDHSISSSLEEFLLNQIVKFNFPG